MKQTRLPIFPEPAIELWEGDCLDLMGDIEDGSVDMVFVDPPYNIKKAEWDKIENYQAWCELWIAECSRVLKPNGAFWVSHSEPLVLADISRVIQGGGRNLINWITWDKYNDAKSLQGFLDGYTLIEGLRSFQWMSEYLIYHADEGEWIRQCDKERGFIFEPLRKYLADEFKRAGVIYGKANEFCGTASMAARHYFCQSQWCLPTKEHYKALRKGLNSGKDGKYLRREYEDLRREYEDLRYTFNNPGKMSSVWQIPPAKANGHPTPKPEELLKRIIEATSNEGDTILDPMMGSGTTGKMAQRLNRNFIGIEKDPEYFQIAKNRIP